MLFADLSLLLSLIFGCCQIILGMAVVQHIVRARRWPSRGAYLLLLISLWFVCSGVAELSVSGMEATRRLLDMPNTVTLARWRGLVDGALIIATGLLALALLNYPLLCRAATRWQRLSKTLRRTPPPGGVPSRRGE